MIQYLFSRIQGNIWKSGCIKWNVILKVAPLPRDIVKLGVDGVNKIWRDAKLRAVGLKRAKTLVNKA